LQDFVKLMDRILRQPTEKVAEGDNDPLVGVISVMLHTYIDEVPKVHRKLLLYPSVPVLRHQ